MFIFFLWSCFILPVAQIRESNWCTLKRKKEKHTRWPWVCHKLSITHKLSWNLNIHPPSRLSLPLIYCSYFSLFHVSVVGTADFWQIASISVFLSLQFKLKSESFFYQVRSCLVTEEAHVWCLTFTFHRLTQFVILYSGGPKRVANNIFEKLCYQIHMFPHTSSDGYLSNCWVLCTAHVVFLLSQHKVTPAEANRVSRDRKGNDTNMRERERHEYRYS